MVYRFFYYLANVAIRIFYRRIYINGLENIKDNQAYFISSNHPAGFMEPIIMACLFPIDLHFLVRGDLFKNPFLRWLLVSTHQIPIFRMKDGFTNLRNNKETVERTVEVLRAKKAMMIFSEGSTWSVQMLRPLKKGFARMAFEAKDADPALDIHILPVGINFSSSFRQGGDVILNIGESFPVNDYYSPDPGQRSKQMNEIVNRTYEEMQKLVLHAPTEERFMELRSDWQKLSLEGKNGFSPRVEKKATIYNGLKEKYKAEEMEGEAWRLNYSKQDVQINGKKSMIMWLLAPLALVGYAAVLIPTQTAKSITSSIVKAIEFKGAILAVSCLFLIPIFFILQFLILAIATSLKVAGIVIGIQIVCAMAYWFFWENLFKSSGKMKIRTHA